MAGYLEETIKSVLSNLGPGDEYYVVDGGSDDGSLDIIRKFEKQITGWVSEPDKGYADAVRKGFAMSRAPLMCWINSGDLLLKGSLDMWRRIFAGAQVDVVFGDDYYIDEFGRVIQHTRGKVSNLKNMMMYGGWTPLQDACAWRRSLYEEIGGIDATLEYAADYDLFLRMSIHGHCQYIPAVLSAFRRHGAQKSVAHYKAYARERRWRQRKQGVHALQLMRLAYRGVAFIRSRISLMNRRSSPYVGKPVMTIPAHYIASEGVFRNAKK